MQQPWWAYYNICILYTRVNSKLSSDGLCDDFAPALSLSLSHLSLSYILYAFDRARSTSLQTFFHALWCSLSILYALIWFAPIKEKKMGNWKKKTCWPTHPRCLYTYEDERKFIIFSIISISIVILSACVLRGWKVIYITSFSFFLWIYIFCFQHIQHIIQHIGSRAAFCPDIMNRRGRGGKNKQNDKRFLASSSAAWIGNTQ